MDGPEPYNPLDLLTIAENIERKLLEQVPSALPPRRRFDGAGIYVIYYNGLHPWYLRIANREIPIYVGKAVAPGSRAGKLGVRAAADFALHKRLVEHAESIQAAHNLELSDFRCRFLVLEDFFIPLGESLAIEHFQPVWNGTLKGFGNHDPGSGRYQQLRSPWDTLHPGRTWADRLRERTDDRDLEEKVIAHLEGEGAAVDYSDGAELET